MGVVHLGHPGHTFINDVIIASVFSTFHSREIRMAAGSVPVTLDWLGLIVYIHSKLFPDSAEDVFSQPHVVTAFDTSGDTDLVLPLAGGDFSIDAGDLESGVDHAAVGSVHDVTAKGVGGAHAAVVLALRLGEAVFGPAIGTGEVASLLLSHKELLFDTEPRVVFFGFFHDLGDDMSEVVSGRSDFVMDEGFT